MPKSTTAGSCGSCMFGFMRNCQTVCQGGWIIYIPSAVRERSGFSASLLAVGVVTILYFSHSDRLRVLISYCGFHLPVPDGKWCWTSCHVLICHQYIFFGEVPINIFCAFFKLSCLFSYCWILSSFHILDTSVLPNMCFANIFSKFVTFPLVFLTVSFIE